MRLSTSLFLFFLLLGTNSVLKAKEQKRLMESARFQGRGNTFVASFDTDDATKGNPATLAEADKIIFQLRPLEFDFFVGENSLETISDLTKIDFANDGLLKVLDTFSDRFGKRQYLRNQFMPLGVRIYSFEISPFVANSNFIDMRVPAIPEVELESDTIMGTNIAYAYALVPKKLFLGLNLKPYYRYYIHGDLAFSDVMDFLPPSSKQIDDIIPQRSGMGLTSDIGITWAKSESWRLGLLVENAGYGGAMNKSDLNPPPLPMRISLGSTWRVVIGKRWNWDIYCDLQDIANPESYAFMRLIHFGSEFGTSYFTRDLDVGLQSGFNEGYFSMGAFADLYLVRFEVVNYAVELGETPGQRMDRRWAISAKTTMTF